MILRYLYFHFTSHRIQVRSPETTASWGVSWDHQNTCVSLACWPYYEFIDDLPNELRQYSVSFCFESFNVD